MAFQEPILKVSEPFLVTILPHTNDLLPSVMAEVCLVLAPDVKLFLN